MSENDVREAIDALYRITATLAYVCERNGMSAEEGSELTERFKRLTEAMEVDA